MRGATEESQNQEKIVCLVVNQVADETKGLL